MGGRCPPPPGARLGPEVSRGGAGARVPRGRSRPLRVGLGAPEGRESDLWLVPPFSAPDAHPGPEQGLSRAPKVARESGTGLGTSVRGGKW